MADDERTTGNQLGDGPADATTNQPYNAKPRPTWTPLVAVVGLFLLIAVIFAVNTWLRYNT